MYKQLVMQEGGVREERGREGGEGLEEREGEGGREGGREEGGRRKGRVVRRR